MWSTRSIALGMLLNEQFDVLTAEPSNLSQAETGKERLFAADVITRAPPMKH